MSSSEFIMPTDVKVKVKESEKLDNYQELARKQ